MTGEIGSIFLVTILFFQIDRTGPEPRIPLFFR